MNGHFYFLTLVKIVIIITSCEAASKKLNLNKKTSGENAGQSILADINIDQEHMKLVGFSAELNCRNGVSVKAKQIDEKKAEFASSHINQGEFCALDLYIDPAKAPEGQEYIWKAKIKTGEEAKGLAYSSKEQQIYRDQDNKLHLSVKLKLVFEMRPKVKTVREIVLPEEANYWISVIEVQKDNTTFEMILMPQGGFYDTTRSASIKNLYDIAKEIDNGAVKNYTFLDIKVLGNKSLKDFLFAQPFTQEFSKKLIGEPLAIAELKTIKLLSFKTVWYYGGFAPVEEVVLKDQKDPRWLGHIRLLSITDKKEAEIFISGAKKYFQSNQVPLDKRSSIWQDFINNISIDSKEYKVYGFIDGQGLSAEGCKVTFSKYLNGAGKFTFDELVPSNKLLPDYENCELTTFDFAGYQFGSANYYWHSWSKLAITR